MSKLQRDVQSLTDPEIRNGKKKLNVSFLKNLDDRKSGFQKQAFTKLFILPTASDLMMDSTDWKVTIKKKTRKFLEK